MIKEFINNYKLEHQNVTVNLNEVIISLYKELEELKKIKYLNDVGTQTDSINNLESLSLYNTDLLYKSEKIKELNIILLKNYEFSNNIIFEKLNDNTKSSFDLWINKKKILIEYNSINEIQSIIYNEDHKSLNFNLKKCFNDISCFCLFLNNYF